VERGQQLLANRIDESFKAAFEIEEAYCALAESSTSEELETFQNDELQDNSDLLKHRIKNIYLQCRILAELMKLPKLAMEIKALEISYGNKFLETEYSPQSGHSFCVSLNKIFNLYSSLKIVIRSGAVTGLNVFETILRNTAKIIADANKEPDHEVEVRNLVLRVLEYSFVDARKEGVISKTLKIYKPDIVVPSLMAAAEYKFARVKTDMKNQFDGIIADMKGYGGHPDWRNFYVVFYQAGAFYTEQQLVEYFRQARVTDNWTPIVLNGPAKLI
jgi:hypothetical protein